MYFQRDKLEQTMDETQKEMNKLRTERDEAVRQHTAIDSRVNDLQVGKDTPPTDLCNTTNLFICCIKCCSIKNIV